MTVYVTFLKRSFEQLSIYRTNSYFSIFSAFISLYILYHVWTALYAGKEFVRGISLDDMMVYVAINALVLAVTQTKIHTEIGTKIREGSLSMDFIKPIHFKWYMFANQMGENAFGLLFHTLPALLFALIFLRIDFQTDPALNAMFLLGLTNGAFLYFQLSYLLGLSVFWLQSSFFVDWVSRAIMRIFAGAFVPLWFYPETLLRISDFLPFKYIVFEPISIYLGKTTIAQAWEVVAFQAGWLFLLIVAEKLVWNRVQRIIDINGG